MNIVSWNVNGLRAIVRKGNWQWFLDENPDIFCIQETKSRIDQLDYEVAYPPKYYSYFSSHKDKKGYSGVAIYSKVKPEEVKEDLGIEELDGEGRILMARYKKFTLFNVYFPNGGGGPERLKYKLEFYDAFLEYIDKLKKNGEKIIFCGDINTAHTEIDLARPKDNEDNTGFLPVEREWIDEVVRHGYVDVFRHFYPDKKEIYTYWDMKTRARDRNVGWRIDYFWASQNIVSKIKSFKTHTDILGSDHCPIEINLNM